jgi:hypothetical protein
MLIVALALVATALCQQPWGPGIDPQAAAIIDHALAAMGGAEAWHSLRGAQVRGNAREEDRRTGAVKSYPFASHHDWSTGQIQSRHEAMDANGQQISAVDPDKVWTRDQAERTKDAPRDPGNALSACMPAAMLAQIKDGGEYRVVAGAGGNDSVQVFRPGPDYAYVPVQIWTFSATTGLPLRASIAVGGRHIALYKTLSFANYQRAKPLFLPKTVEIEYPDGVEQTFTFETINLVPATSSSNAAQAR